jgi:hypothetical protein
MHGCQAGYTHIHRTILNTCFEPVYPFGNDISVLSAFLKKIDASMSSAFTTSSETPYSQQIQILCGTIAFRIKFTDDAADTLISMGTMCMHTNWKAFPVQPTYLPRYLIDCTAMWRVVTDSRDWIVRNPLRKTAGRIVKLGRASSETTVVCNGLMWNPTQDKCHR